MDGTHIPIISPCDYPADYYNRKGWHSIIMQGVVDNKGLFTDIYIGWPGRVHDARVFANSSLYREGRDGTLFPDWVEKIGSTDIPIVGIRPIPANESFPRHALEICQGSRKYLTTD